MGVILWRPSTTLKARQLRSLEDCALSKNVALLNIKTFWSLCSSSRRWRAFGKNWVTNFAISAAVLCYGDDGDRASKELTAKALSFLQKAYAIAGNGCKLPT